MIKLFLDADDTILNSSETIIEILNDKHNLHPRKTIKDLTSWNFNSIYPMTRKDLMSIFESDEFFERVTFKKGFLEFYNKFKNTFKIIIVTKGTLENLKKKSKFFKKFLPDAEIQGLILTEEQSFDKSLIDMTGGIQVDDRMDCLSNTKASIKILIKNFNEFPWNNMYNTVIDNLYAVNTWEEISEIYDFFQKYNTEEI